MSTASKIRHLTTAALLLGFASVSAPAFAQATYGTTFGGSGGTAYDVQCPASSPWITGVTSRWGSYVDSVKGLCGASQSTSWVGGAGGSEGTIQCGAGRVLVGLAANYGAFLDGTWIWCQDLSEVQAGLTGGVTVGRIGGNGGGSNGSWRCPLRQAAVGFYGGAGQYIDRMGLICKPV